ncbi:AI-2E family transporter [Croceicoccus sp. YJ47]|uniref:AI-2E family transporter n=1 Tax=Croceicoccus sp. YJ47 TaxID=2798724 RepID=UPI0019250BF0|nr:AI-2E family transporter [Croceicoccus sp. YJ47]QQN75393.1 AI-2E family transporter [Croceicoccus sp. YJ47]
MNNDNAKRPYRRGVERGGFIVFLALITLAMVWVSWPFVSAVLWAMLAAIMFQPLYRRILVNLGGKENRAAILTLLVITFAIVVPAIAIGTIVVEQATAIYFSLLENPVDISDYYVILHDSLPIRIRAMIDQSGYGDFAAIQEQVLDFLRQSAGIIASQAVSIGGSAFSFALTFAVGLYVTYFLLRDGRHMVPIIRDSLPMDAAIARRLMDSFTTIVRATIKGSVVVGLVQGALGAVTFWIVGVPSALLFGLLMALFSLLPALGPAIVWVPVAIWLLATGAIWQGLVVIASGVLVIGLADNVLRPILVGRDTGIPDWLVLVSTLGGIATMGLSGIVVGPLLAGLFLSGWAIMRERRMALD